MHRLPGYPALLHTASVTALPPTLWSREWNSGIFRHCLDTAIRNPQKFIFMSATNPLWASAVLLTERMVQPMDKPTVQDIFHRFYPAYLDQYSPSPVQAKAAHNIMNCKTGAYGANVCVCGDCGFVQIHYNSCRNRCCPMCQAVPKEMWMDARREDILDAPYFHLVFTVPDILNPVIYSNQRLLYDALYHAASSTISELTADPKHLGAKVGYICILHTWGSIPTFIPSCWVEDWIPHCKKTFNGAQTVMKYLGKYTHRIAVSNHRIVRMDDDTVTFLVKDYRNDGQWKELTISGIEFVRRFLMHVPPRRFVRIRHYGLLCSRTKSQKITLCRNLLGCKKYLSKLRDMEKPEILEHLYGIKVCVCKACGGHLGKPQMRMPLRC